MSLNANQKLTLKDYLTTNPDSIPSLSANLTAEHFTTVQAQLNAVTEGKSARKPSESGSSIKMAMASTGMLVSLATKDDVYELLKDPTIAINDTNQDGIEDVINAGGAGSAEVLAAFREVITASPVSLAAALFNNSALTVSEGDVADSWRGV